MSLFLPVAMIAFGVSLLLCQLVGDKSCFDSADYQLRELKDAPAPQPQRPPTNQPGA